MNSVSELSERPAVLSLAALISAYPADPQAIIAAGRAARRAQKTLTSAAAAAAPTRASLRDPQVNNAVDDAVLAFVESLARTVNRAGIDELDPELLEGLSSRAGEDFADVWRSAVAESRS